MKLQVVADWQTFNLGIVIHPASGLYVGIGPFLVRLIWGPIYWRCSSCGEKQFAARGEHIPITDTLLRLIEELQKALWFEHYHDVHPEGRIDHGDCVACRLIATLAAGEEEQDA